MAAFSERFQSLHAGVVDDGRSCSCHREWLLETGAMVTHVPVFAQAVELMRSRAHEFDLLLIDADAHRGWRQLVELSPARCRVLLVSAEAGSEILHCVTEHGAGCLSKDVARQDFVWGVYELVRSAGIPDLDDLAERGARLWGLSPQLGRVLHYNLWGHSDREIAAALSLSLKTVQQYQGELRRKTGVATKYAYLRRLLMLAGCTPPLPTEDTRARAERDRDPFGRRAR